MWELFKSFSLGGRFGMVGGLLVGLAGAAVPIWAEPIGGTVLVVVVLVILVVGFWLAFRPQVRRNRFDIPPCHPGAALRVVVDPKDPMIVAAV
jgi:hypothetical protein